MKLTKRVWYVLFYFITSIFGSYFGKKREKKNELRNKHPVRGFKVSWEKCLEIILAKVSRILM